MASAKIVFECFTLFIVSTLFVVPAAGIYCYQCVSTNNEYPFQCNEFLTSDIDMEPKSCDAVHGAKFCVKHVGRFEDGVGTKRFCSSADLGNYCQTVQQVGDERPYRTCLYTCNTDGCNPGSMPKPNSITTAISLTLLFLLRWTR
ncbi:U-scoloptoxin(05)-Sm1a isoform X1 [Venturia canescens]|uniref:U-scoloptoxin(05)-Sm1a isoform X1 n=1 Tax=Venturia canescens TaxID=32260 RepID=UPI001C9C9FD2|nr:U-scoloptoxin(05)-Sm1a isoform X1 [Venturia canescens]